MDWQPFWGEGDGKDSAADYERYRKFYAGKMEQLLHGSEHDRYTRKSHLFSSIVSACGDSMSDSFVVQRILKIVLDDEYEYDYEERIGKEWNPEKEAMLREKFRDFWRSDSSGENLPLPYRSKKCFTVWYFISSRFHDTFTAVRSASII
jgi:hypothetical protein